MTQQFAVQEDEGLTKAGLDHTRNQRSESIIELVKAMVKFQGSITAVPKTSDNPFFHSKYADLDAIWAMCRKPLSDNGLALIQTTATVEGQIYLDTVVAHISGEYISSRYPIIPMKQAQGAGWQASSDPQSIGSAITYSRRYAMSAILGIVSDEDDDGAGARQGVPSKPRPRAAPAAHSPVTATVPAGTPTSPPGGDPMPLDNRYYCAEHRTNWTKHTGKDGKSTWYSHKQGDGWCNMEDVSQGGSESEKGDFEARLARFFQWAREKHGIDAQQALAAANTSMDQVTDKLDLHWAAEQVGKLYGKKAVKDA